MVDKNEGPLSPGKRSKDVSSQKTDRQKRLEAGEKIEPYPTELSIYDQNQNIVVLGVGHSDGLSRFMANLATEYGKKIDDAFGLLPREQLRPVFVDGLQGANREVPLAVFSEQGINLVLSFFTSRIEQANSQGNTERVNKFEELLIEFLKLFAEEVKTKSVSSDMKMLEYKKANGTPEMVESSVKLIREKLGASRAMGLSINATFSSFLTMYKDIQKTHKTSGSEQVIKLVEETQKNAKENAQRSREYESKLSKY